MKITVHRILWFIMPLLLVAFLIGGCKKSSDSTGPSGDNSDIPANPTQNIPVPTINNIIPSATFTSTSGNSVRIQVNLLGVINPSTGLPIELNSGNVFVVEDGILKGVKVTSVGGGVTLKADVVFVVDNSGSMSEEADSIANKIIAFSNYLQASGMDIKVGCVGQGYNSDQGIYGAQNLTSASTLSTYLNRSTGLERTYGYSGSDSSRLASAASTFAPYDGGENSIVGIYFADQKFTWRPGANRVYVTFTDEPTQPGNHLEWSTDGFRASWTASKGTIHTVWSDGVDTSYYSWQAMYSERPWTLSHLTGGTVKLIESDAAGLNLTQLPVTGALSNSYLIEYITSNPTGTHTVVIIVKTTGADGSVTYTNITYL